jgi:hypothetical protein
MMTATNQISLNTAITVNAGQTRLVSKILSAHSQICVTKALSFVVSVVKRNQIKLVHMAGTVMMTSYVTKPVSMMKNVQGITTIVFQESASQKHAQIQMNVRKQIIALSFQSVEFVTILMKSVPKVIPAKLTLLALKTCVTSMTTIRAKRVFTITVN